MLGTPPSNGGSLAGRSSNPWSLDGSGETESQTKNKGVFPVRLNLKPFNMSAGLGTMTGCTASGPHKTILVYTLFP